MFANGIISPFIYSLRDNSIVSEHGQNRMWLSHERVPKFHKGFGHALGLLLVNVVYESAYIG